jgi:hypothetical protein
LNFGCDVEGDFAVSLLQLGRVLFDADELPEDFAENLSNRLDVESEVQIAALRDPCR